MKAKHFNLVLKKEIQNEFIVTAMYKDLEWVDGKPTNKIKGYKLKTVCPSAQYDETIVKIECQNPPLDEDALNKNPITVTFENLTFSSYYNSNSNRTEYVGKASGVKVIN